MKLEKIVDRIYKLYTCAEHFSGYLIPPSHLAYTEILIDWSMKIDRANSLKGAIFIIFNFSFCVCSNKHLLEYIENYIQIFHPMVNFKQFVLQGDCQEDVDQRQILE